MKNILQICLDHLQSKHPQVCRELECLVTHEIMHRLLEEKHPAEKQEEKEEDPILINLPFFNRNELFGLPLEDGKYARPEWWNKAKSGHPVHVFGWKDASNRQKVDAITLTFNLPNVLFLDRFKDDVNCCERCGRHISDSSFMCDDCTGKVEHWNIG